MTNVDANYIKLPLGGHSIAEIFQDRNYCFDPKISDHNIHPFFKDKGTSIGQHMVCCREVPPNKYWRRASASESIFITIFSNGLNGAYTWKVLHTSSQTTDRDQTGRSPTVFLTKINDKIGIMLEYDTLPNMQSLPSFWLSNS